MTIYRIRRTIIQTLTVAVAIAFAAVTPSFAQVHQENWLPNEYRLYCEQGGSGILSVFTNLVGNSNCKSEEVARKVAEDMKEAMSSFKEMGFRPPLRFGERIGAGGPAGEDYIRIYDVDARGLASTSAPCPNTFISVKNDIIIWWRDYLVFEFLAHEAFHAVSHAYPTTNDRCQVPAGWIFEGIADAVALDLTRKKFGDPLPPMNEPDKVHAKFAGLRRYDVPLNFDLEDEDGESIGTGLTVQYNTNSLFRFIADAFHGGDHRYIHNYLLRPRPDQDWLAWLNDNVENRDSKIKKHLGLVHSAFLASYAGWGDPGLPGGNYFKRAKWRDRAFGGCETVRLSRSDTAVGIDMALRPSSGKCIEVIVADVGPEDRVTIQVGAIDENASPGVDFKLFDQLYLGFADSTDSKRFHCARWIKEGRKNAAGKCSFIGDTGTLTIDNKKYHSRVWNVVAQSKGVEPDPEGPAKEVVSQVPSRAGRMANTYVISRMDPEPTDLLDTTDGGPEEAFTLWFMLDVGKVEVTPAIDKKPPTPTAKKRTVAHVNGEPVTNSQETVPMQNTEGGRTVTYTNPASVRPLIVDELSSMATPNIPGLEDLHTLQLSNVWSDEVSDYEDTLDEYETYIIKPLRREGNSWAPRSVAVGETGTFPVMVTGGLIDGSLSLQSIEPGELEIKEFSFFTLRATVRATVCNFETIREDGTCVDTRTIAGEITKAFPGARLPGSALMIYDTPGTAIYRRAKQGSLEGLVDGDRDAGRDGRSGTGGGGGGGSTGNESCDCTCKGYDRIQKLTAEMRSGRPDPSRIAEIQKLAVCASKCAASWKDCPKQE